jgi:cysteinyl-tRNA synthetase
LSALDNDLNISGAMGHLFDLIRETNKALDAGWQSAPAAEKLYALWERIDGVLGLGPSFHEIPPEVIHLIEEREQARLVKDWPVSDNLRTRILELGWLVKDTKEGPKLTAR